MLWFWQSDYHIYISSWCQNGSRRNHGQGRRLMNLRRFTSMQTILFGYSDTFMVYWKIWVNFNIQLVVTYIVQIKYSTDCITWIPDKLCTVSCIHLAPTDITSDTIRNVFYYPPFTYMLAQNIQCRTLSYPSGFTGTISSTSVMFWQESSLSFNVAVRHVCTSCNTQLCEPQVPVYSPKSVTHAHMDQMYC
jgi:hypothetical protein